MEFLFTLFFDAIRGAARPRKQFRRRKLAELREVMTDPAQALAERTVPIGPVRHYVLGAFALGLLCLPGFAIAFGEPEGAANGQGKKTEGERLGGLICLLAGFGIASLAIYLSRGGSMVLHAGGVELRGGANVVFCPWALFNTTGQSFDAGSGDWLLPVAPRALPFVMWHRRGVFTANGVRVQTKQISFPSFDQAVLANFYEADLGAISHVLYEIGRKLGPKLPDAEAVSREGGQLESDHVHNSLLTHGTDGWVTIPLTKIHLPASCSTCLAPTTTSFDLNLYKPGHNKKNWVIVRVPFCQFCRKLAKQWQYRFAFRGVCIGLLIVGAIGLTIDFGKPDDVAGWLCLGIPFVLASGLFGLRIGEKRTAPARFRRFSPKKGTISLWFRNSEYTDLVVANVERTHATRSHSGNGGG